ncbi:MAG: hypothetical protein ABJA98_19260 [Acidobacteriota bacterium]
MTRADAIRAMTKAAASSTTALREVDLADVLIASDMEIESIGPLLVTITAYCDADELYDGFMPPLTRLDDPGIPAAVRAVAGDVVLRAFANANMHRTPYGQPS